MEIKKLEVFSEDSNLGIVRMPGRRFPGCVIQGDTLFNLLAIAENVQALAAATGANALISEMQELVEVLAERLDHYESVLKRHGLDLPYVRSV